VPENPDEAISYYQKVMSNYENYMQQQSFMHQQQ
jgi:hypothetical protein